MGIGKGAYREAWLVYNEDTQRVHVMKALSEEYMLSRDQLRVVSYLLCGDVGIE